MSNKSMDGTVQVERAPQQQTVLSPQLRNHDRHQSVGEGLKTHDNRNEDIGGSGLDDAGRLCRACECIIFLERSGRIDLVSGTHRVSGLPHWNLTG